MDLLQSHVKGDAKSLIHGLGYSGRNYATCLQELKGAFGHRVKVARAYLERITNGPAIQTHDIQSLKQFYLSIRDCVTTLSQLNYMADLRSCDLLMKTSKRLPSDKIPKWNERANSILKTREPTILDLQVWLKERLDADTNPYAIQFDSIKKIQRSTQKLPISTSQERKVTTLNTGVNADKLKVDEIKPNIKTFNQSQDPEKKLSCCLCKEKHYLYRCRLFLEKPVPERYSTVVRHSLCHNCLKPNHKTSECYSVLSCRYPQCKQPASYSITRRQRGSRSSHDQQCRIIWDRRFLPAGISNGSCIRQNYHNVRTSRQCQRNNLNRQ